MRLKWRLGRFALKKIIKNCVEIQKDKTNMFKISCSGFQYVSVRFQTWSSLLVQSFHLFLSVSICFCLFPNQVKTSCTGFPSVPVSFQNDLQTSYTEILSVSISFQTWSRLVHGFHLFLSVSKLDEDFLYRVSICFSQVPNMIKTSSWLVQGFHLFLPVSICFSLFPIVQVVRKDSNFFVLSFKWNGNMKICSRQSQIAHLSIAQG